MSKKLINNLLLISVLALLGVGIIMVYSSSSITAVKTYHDEYYFLKKQIVFACLGFLLLMAVTRLPYQYLGKMAYPILGLSFLSLVLVLVPGIGMRIGGAMRWFRLGPVSIQPAECAKMALVIFLGFFFSSRPEIAKKFFTGFVPPLAITGVMALLCLRQPDFGSASVFLALLMILLFAAGTRWYFLASLLVPLLPLGFFLIKSSPYRWRRFTAFLNPWEDPSNTGFQIIQSYLAFGSGGVSGVGLGNGRQKLFYLPEAHTDFIFSVIGEELGLIGVLVTIALFAMVIFCGFRIACQARDPLGTYLALGLVSLIGLQALVNMGVVMGLLPTKGSALPFVSYGGSALLVDLVGVGVMLNISSQSGTG